MSTENPKLILLMMLNLTELIQLPLILILRIQRKRVASHLRQQQLDEEKILSVAIYVI